MSDLWIVAEAATQRARDIESYTLHPSGWIVMILSLGFVIGLLGWCVWQVTRESSPEKLHGPIDVDTRDTTS